MYQMIELRPNIIVTAESSYVYSHDINNPHNTMIHKLFDYSNTKNIYLTIAGLESNEGDFAIGGYTNTTSPYSGYVELFHLEEDNSTLHPIPNKQSIIDEDYCAIRIIREIQTGVIIFGGDYNCENICTWEYAVVPHTDPHCFGLGGTYIYDIMPLS